jgi:DNA-binding beta-propeller fold protein YncE
MGFASPVAAAFGKDGVVYVVSRGSESISNVPWNRTGVGARVSQVKAGLKTGEEEFLGEFSGYGDDDGQFIWGAGIAADGQGNLYVTDEWLNRVSVFDKDGNFLRHWGTVQAGEGEPNGASGIAIDGQGILYVTDGRSHKVRKFTADGKFLESWGRRGSGPGELDSPWGITVDHQGYVYVADFKNHRAQKFTPEGEFLAQFGAHGTRRGQLNHPTGVAVDPEGDVYICDWSKNGWESGRIHIFDKDGKFITSLLGDAQQLSSWGQMTVDANADYEKRRREVRTTEPEWRLAQPSAVAFDAQNGRLLVVDTQRNRFQMYNKQSQYMVPQMNL